MRYITQYDDLTYDEVQELYRQDVWQNLSAEQRYDALQELENRAAEENGISPCLVRPENMNGAVYGGYCNGEIIINSNLVERGEFVHTYVNEDGVVDTDTYQIEGANAELMDTMYHENFHSYQDNVLSGRVEHHDAEEVQRWRDNSYQEGIYIDNRCGTYDDLYRIQDYEKSAFARGEEKTKEAFESMEDKYGADEGYDRYKDNVEANSYDNALARAQDRYDDVDIDKNYINAYVEDKMENQSSNSNYVGDESIDHDEDENITM